MKTDDFINLSQAALLTGKSEITIRRLCLKNESKPYVKSSNSKPLIQVGYLQGKYHFAIPDDNKMLSDDIKVKTDDITSTDHQSHSEIHDGQPPLTTTKGVEGLLQKEYYQNIIAAKDETIRMISDQLQSKDQQINQLIERDRESNIIIQSLQDKVIHQLKPAQASQSTQEKKRYLTDNLLIGVAIASAIALLAFIGMMLYAFLSR